jgi:PII-like signaling protein
MQPPQNAQRLRIYIGESDRYENRPLAEAIVLRARERHLAGATVVRGPLGFGHSSRLHTAKILRLSMDLPVVIDIVDTETKIQAFVPELQGMVGGGLITIETVQVLHYHGEPPVTALDSPQDP